jgi:hypothetical protein
MPKHHPPAIVRLVEHHGGPVALSEKLGGRPVYQEISRWLRRGWASPMHIFKLKPLLPRGIKLEDLDADRERASAEATR